ncbi:MAG TPA: hypothetical protein VEQ63_09680, partial [Bryobacteraceae bacterium]|nr:hypothetical protein [Bryobacteraceae bacterium]
DVKLLETAVMEQSNQDIEMLRLQSVRDRVADLRKQLKMIRETDRRVQAEDTVEPRNYSGNSGSEKESTSLS